MVISYHIIYRVISLMSDRYVSILCWMLPFCLETTRAGRGRQPEWQGEWKISSGTGSILATVRSLWQRMPRRGSVYHCMLWPVILQSWSKAMKKLRKPWIWRSQVSFFINAKADSLFHQRIKPVPCLCLWMSGGMQNYAKFGKLQCTSIWR